MKRESSGVKVDQRKKDVSMCMVVGCSRVALYQNAGTRRLGVKRGYCSAHKALAVTAFSEKSAAAQADWTLRGVN